MNGNEVHVSGMGIRERYVAVDSSAAELGGWEDWAFMRELDGFIPTTYEIKMEVADGIYQIKAHVCNATTWGLTFKAPDYPVAALTFDTVEGSFIYLDGSRKNLTGGRGVLSVRQWHAYPNILPRELYSDEVKQGKKFDTL